MFAQRGNTPADGGDTLADAKVDALKKGRIALPAVCRHDLLYAF
jgi:hypothetical protein